MKSYKYTINDKFSDNVLLSEFVKTLPSVFETEGQLIYKGRNIVKKFVLADGMVLVVKKYKTPAFIQRVIYSFFRKNKAQRAFENAEKLIHLGFNTPVNISWAKENVNGLIDHCFFVSDEDNNPPIEKELFYFKDFNKALAEDFAQFVANLHSKGVIHKDLNSTNVLYRRRSEGNYEFSLIDNNRMKFYKEGTEPPLRKCLENLTLFTGDLDVFRQVAIYYSVSRCWNKDIMTDKIVRVKIRHDKLWKIRKKITHPFSSRRKK